MKSQYLFLPMLVLFYLIPVYGISQLLEKNLAPNTLDIDYKASPRPDRILITLTENPATEIMITWRTDSTVIKGIAQIAKVEKQNDFYKKAIEKPSTTTVITSLENENVIYHKVKFENLLPNSAYTYRVGDGTYWSEWIQFRTSEEEFTEPFQFIYLGDAQNDIFPLWSRAIRGAYKKAPNARFIIHVGDLVNHAQNNYEWGEWFKASGFIPKMTPTLATLGNHEYIKDKSGNKLGVGNLWAPQFNFPDNGPNGFEDRTYFVDYLNCRIICLDSNSDIEAQKKWLIKTLSDHHKQWVVVFFHHPVISAAKGRANDTVLRHWKPLFDKYKVDLVLQGHDHVYGRGNMVNPGLGQGNKDSGTTYVVSVSGRKMYSLSNHPWMDKKGENMQLYQVITVNKNTLNFKAYTLDIH